MKIAADIPSGLSRATNLDWAAQLICAQEGFKQAKVLLEIGGGDFRRVAALAEAFPTKQFFSIDMAYSPKAIETVQQFAASANLNVIKSHSKQRVFADDMFDFVFSSAVMEHIPELDLFLDEMWRVTKNSGRHYFIESPFWSSYKGHHFRHHDSSVVRILGGYKHLLFNKDEMLSYLSSLPHVPFDIQECVRCIYNRTDLSRLTRNETFECIRNSQFTVAEWIDMTDECFDSNAALAVTAKGRYKVDDMRVKGAYVTLVK
jgi:ubiquinone/menaquinone biosynthesis C-methylase UbiE